MIETPNLGLPLLAAAQAQKHVTHNEALVLLDALAQLAVQGRGAGEPPAGAAEGQRWIVGPAAAGAWANHAGEIALRLDGAWSFRAPKPGWTAYVLDERQLVAWAPGAGWQPAVPASLQNLARLGLGTQADAANPFAAKLNKALWTALTAAEGGDGCLRYTLNKEGPADVLSILLQSGFSARVELGLVGDDDLAIKVSADGAAWREALRVDRASGLPRFPAAPRFAALLNYGQYVPAAAWTKVAFNDAAHDDQGAFDAGASAFVAPAAGLYRFDARVAYRANGAAPTQLDGALHRDGALLEATRAAVHAPAGLVSGVSGVATSALLRLEAGDAVDVRVLYAPANAFLFHERSHFHGHLVP